MVLVGQQQGAPTSFAGSVEVRNRIPIAVDDDPIRTGRHCQCNGKTLAWHLKGGFWGQPHGCPHPRERTC